MPTMSSFSMGTHGARVLRECRRIERPETLTEHTLPELIWTSAWHRLAGKSSLQLLACHVE
jgi:hypothetical protein